MDTLVKALRQVVADTYAVIGQTHLCHWNVRGSSFFSLHQAFEEQYTELFAAAVSYTHLTLPTTPYV